MTETAPREPHVAQTNFRGVILQLNARLPYRPRHHTRQINIYICIHIRKTFHVCVPRLGRDSAIFASPRKQDESHHGFTTLDTFFWRAFESRLSPRSAAIPIARSLRTNLILVVRRDRESLSLSLFLDWPDDILLHVPVDLFDEEIWTETAAVKLRLCYHPRGDLKGGETGLVVVLQNAAGHTRDGRNDIAIQAIPGVR